MADGTRKLQDDRIIDFGEIFAKLAARRWWLIASVVLFTGGFTATAFLMTPVYRSATILAPAGEARMSGGLGSALGQLGDLASLAGVTLGSNSSETEETLAVLRSREFTESFIRDEGLTKEFFASKWDVASGRWKVPEKKIPTLGKAYKYFDKKVRTIISDKKTGLITLQIDWTDRDEAASWANELVRRLNAEMRARAIARANASVGYLEKEFGTTSTIETREAIGRLMEAQIKQRMVANVSEDYAFRVVDKAMASDKDDPQRPQKVLLIVAGFLIGTALGIAVALSLPDPDRAAQ
jgi:uncharacterized protein involved in exopolysaccharide biosynthesis